MSGSFSSNWCKDDRVVGTEARIMEGWSAKMSSHREVRPESDTVERSGQAIVDLLQQASDDANANCDRAREYALKASVQLRAAEDRIKELEVDLRHYQDRAQRAEERAQHAESWLVRIYKDVEK